MSTQFVLHPQLAADCHLLGTHTGVQILLHQNALIPWIILVPEGDYLDFDQLSSQHQQALLAISHSASQILREHFACTKINVAAIGNMVPQFHWHVVGRSPDDACWPAPVWGNLAHSTAWGDAAVNELRAAFKTAMGGE